MDLVADKIGVVWRLPPVILHPFAGEKGPDRLLEGSRANMALNGLVPNSNLDRHELTQRVLAGRYQEFRMLFYIGKDLQRWTEQCVDFVGREPKLNKLGIREQSFSTLLVEHPPPGLAAKLTKWGVTDQRAIFSRAIGLNAMFQEVPSIEALSDVFVQNYQRFADYLFIAYQTMNPYLPLMPQNFIFDLYASDEYARILSEGWE